MTLPSDNQPRVLFLNRSYWPDAEATGQLLTELCEDLAGEFDVTVIAGQPNRNLDGAVFRSIGAEQRAGVTVRRVWNSRFPKRSFFGKAANLLTYLAAATVAALRIKRPDIVVVETDPPLLCLLGWILQRWRGARLIVYLQDIYPDVAVALGKLPSGWPTTALRRLFFRIYRNADRVVVLSRDMRRLLVASGVSDDKITVIPNWVDTRLVQPIKERNSFREQHCLDGQFVVMYSGNLGLSQGLEQVLHAAEQLKDAEEIVFLLVGDGASKVSLQQQASALKLTNVRFLDYQPKSALAQSLSAADIHLVMLDPKCVQHLMPSKLYGILASGTPMLVVAPDDCELSELTRDEQVGLVVHPADPDALATAVRVAASQREQFAEMGARARRLATERFDRRISTTAFASLVRAVLGESCETVASDESLQQVLQPELK